MKPMKRKKHNDDAVDRVIKKKKHQGGKGGSAATSPGSKKAEHETHVDMGDFVASTSVEEMMDEAESSSELNRYETVIVGNGDNVFMILPGTKSTDGKTIVSRMVHGIKTPCARSKRVDRFETCAQCNYWFENRSTKEERDKGNGTAADDLRPKDIGITQIIDVTCFCEHETVRKENNERVSVLSSTDIDIKRVKKCPCFLDLTKLNADSDECKKCLAFKSCFQGPQFLLMSSPRVKDMLTEQKRIGGKKIVEINGKKIKLRGNIAMAWHVLHGDKDVAKKVSYQFIYTKSLDPKKDKRFGTSYKAAFSRDPFVLPSAWQKNALSRARDLGKFLLPITKDESIKALNLFLKSSKNEKNMACFNNEEIKDSEHCIGEGCSSYDECCKKHGKKDKDKKHSKHNKKETKQEKAIRDMSDEDGDIDDVIERMNKALDD